MSEKWYYQIMGEVVGPLSADEVRAHAQNGLITPDTLVRKGAEGRWVTAHRVKGLFDRKPATAPSPPPRQQAPDRREPPVATPEPSPARSRAGKVQLRRRLTTYGGIGALVLVVLAAFVWYMLPVSREKMVARAEQSVAHIRGNTSQGTGFLVDSKLLVTNRHVIAREPDSHLRITFPSSEDRKHDSFSARVVYESPEVDLAILELQEEMQYLRLASSHRFTRGQEVTVIGNPGLDDEIVLENAVSRGILSTTTNIDGNDYFQLDISINPGNSGGPVLDNSGRVIGLVTLKATEKEGLGFCIPLSQLTSALETLEELDEEEKQKNSSMHNLRAITRLLSTIGEVYKFAMATYVESMTDSIQHGGSADRGLSAVQPTVNRLVSEVDDAIIGKIESEVSRLGADSRIPDSLRQKFVDAWANYKELKSYVENPRGSLLTYRAKHHELADQHDRLIESLKLLSDIRD